MKKHNRFMIYAFIFGFVFAVIAPFKQTYVGKDFQPYYNEFMEIVKEYCSEDQYFHPNFKIEFHRLPGKEIGSCLTRPDRFIIYIDLDYWNTPVSNSEEKRYSLMFHELSHCILDLDHSDDPENYMYYSDYHIGSKEEVNEQLKVYLKEVCP